MSLQSSDFSAPAAALLALNGILIFAGLGVLFWQAFACFAPKPVPEVLLPAAPARRILPVIAAAVCLFFVGNIVGALPLHAYAGFLKRTDSGAFDSIRECLNAYATIAGTVCGQVFLICGLLFFLRLAAPDFRFKAPAVRAGSGRAWHPFACLFGGFALSWAGGMLSMSLKAGYEFFSGEKISLPKQETFEMIAANRDNAGFVLLLLLAVVVLAPVSEELFFRGVLFRIFRGAWNRVAAAVACGVLFGLIHFNVFGFLSLSLLGAYWCFVYEKNGDIRVSMFAHAVFNLNSMAIALFAPELAEMF